MGLTYSSVVDASVDEVFGWHARLGAITRLAPPWQPIRVIHEARSLRDGRAVLGLPGGLRWIAAEIVSAKTQATANIRSLGGFVSVGPSTDLGHFGPTIVRFILKPLPTF